MAYATPTELADHLAPDPAPAGAALLLDRASRDVNTALLCARYDRENADVVEALTLATLEQAAHRIETGDETGLGSAVPSGQIGSVRVDGTAGSRPGGTVPLGPQAWQVLQLAGLTGDGPIAAG